MPDDFHKVTLPFILAALHTSEQDLKDQGLDAEELLLIYNDYLTRLSDLATIAEFISVTLQKSPRVYTIKHRTKDPLHLLQIIIRKKKEYPERIINHQNYLSYINDLIGLRILHIYKKDWVEIGAFIQERWALKRKPHVYIKHSDIKSDTTSYTCKSIVHPAGYSAVHFVIETTPYKQCYYAEIQLRTLFEEAWSEIDHNIRYPDHAHYTLLDDLLQLLNKFTGNADELASLIRILSREFSNHTAAETTKPEVTETLKMHLNNLQLPEKEKQLLYQKIFKIISS